MEAVVRGSFEDLHAHMLHVVDDMMSKADWFESIITLWGWIPNRQDNGCKNDNEGFDNINP